MPVVPQGISPFQVFAPLTTGDDGEPTDSIWKDAHRVFDFIKDERHLEAYTLLEDVRLRIESWESEQTEQQRKDTTQPQEIETPKKRSPFRGVNKKTKNEEEVESASQNKRDVEFSDTKNLLDRRKRDLETLENRCRLFRRALDNAENAAGDWTLASSFFGVQTFYRREDDGTMSLKMEGEVKDVPLFEQVCVLREVDLHYKWAPFCTSSMTLADLDKLDTVGWFMIGLANFGISRDGCFRAIGCDNTYLNDTLIITGCGVNDDIAGCPLPPDTYLRDDPVLDHITFPPQPKRFGAARMAIRVFDAIIQITSPTSARTRIVANIDPNMKFVPQVLLEFVLKHVAGIVLAKMQGAAKKAVKYPLTNEHARRMRDEEDFYRHWLMAKFQAVCDQKGWVMPPVNAFELDDDDLRRDHQHAERRGRGGVTFDVDGTRDISFSNVEFPSDATSLISDPGRVTTDSDAVSALTSKSGNSVWSSTPIGKYLRNRQVEKIKKKKREIEDSRRNAAKRLEPRARTSEEQKRLDELQAAKARRLDSPKISSQAGSQARDETTQAEHSKSLSDHAIALVQGFIMTKRIPVMSGLVLFFFLLLHPQLLLAVLNLQSITDHDKRWWMTVLQDAGFLIYMSFCSFVHFLTCDVALVYAFDSLELGSKAGTEVRNYYTTNVRDGVAAASMGIFGVSLANSLTKVTIRVGMFTLSAVLNSLTHVLAFAWDEMPLKSEATTVTSALATAATLLFKVFVNSNPLGRQIAKITTASLDFFEEQLEESRGEPPWETLASWRADTYNTSRLLYSYTSVFLVTTLILFNLSTTPTKATPKKVRPATPQNSQTRSPARQLQPTETSVPEAQSAQTSVPEAALSVTPVSDEQSAASSGSKRRRRGLLRLRRNLEPDLSAVPEGVTNSALPSDS